MGIVCETHESRFETRWEIDPVFMSAKLENVLSKMLKSRKNIELPVAWIIRTLAYLKIIFYVS